MWRACRNKHVLQDIVGHWEQLDFMVYYCRVRALWNGLQVEPELLKQLAAKEKLTINSLLKPLTDLIADVGEPAVLPHGDENDNSVANGIANPNTGPSVVQEGVVPMPASNDGMWNVPPAISIGIENEGVLPSDAQTTLQLEADQDNSPYVPRYETWFALSRREGYKEMHVAATPHKVRQRLLDMQDFADNWCALLLST